MSDSTKTVEELRSTLLGIGDSLESLVTSPTYNQSAKMIVHLEGIEDNLKDQVSKNQTMVLSSVDQIAVMCRQVTEKLNSINVNTSDTNLLVEKSKESVEKNGSRGLQSLEFEIRDVKTELASINESVQSVEGAIQEIDLQPELDSSSIEVDISHADIEATIDESSLADAISSGFSDVLGETLDLILSHARTMVSNNHNVMLDQMKAMHKTQERMLFELQRLALDIKPKEKPVTTPLTTETTVEQSEMETEELFAKSDNAGGGFNSFL